MKDIRVRVTDAHRQAARPGSVEFSPLALAASVATRARCFVTSTHLQWPGRAVAPLPAWLRARLQAFDDTGELEPFEIVLRQTRAGQPLRILAADQAAEVTK